MLEKAMTPSKRTARIAGFLYLLVTVAGVFILIYVPGKLFVPGDATATAGNILGHVPLFRAYMVAGIASELLFMAVVLVLYRLLEGVGRPLASLMVILVLVDAPLAFAGVANQAATLALLRGGQFLAAFDGPQRDALATLLLTVEREGSLVSELFWGLWLLPLGMLVFRSGFLPRFLGVWLFVNGLAYLVISSTGLLLPQHLKLASTVATPFLLGEVVFTLWLLIAGVRVPPEKGGASATP